MKIYFGASISFDRSLLPTYQLVVSNIKKLGHKVISEYVVDPKLKPGENLNPEKLFEREMKTIEKADLMVAEVTVPSWGTAFLIEHALEHRIPVLALFYKDALHRLPAMIAGHPELYLDHYDEDNVESVIGHFFKFAEETKNRRGKLLVLDGIDASGKATQAELLKKALKKMGLDVKTVTFPRYYSSFHGKTIGRLLSGEFGEVGSVSPYLSSLAYALDRITARKQIREWLLDGSIIIADRYTSSSMAHQAAKLPPRRRRAFVNWIDEMEYRRHKIPREDLTIFLHVPLEVSRKLLGKKGKRAYIKRVWDVAEADVDHQKEALKMYLKLVREKGNWEKVDCVDKDGKILSKTEIHKRIMTVLRKRKIIS